MDLWRDEGHEVNDNVKEFLENIHDAGDAVGDTADLLELYTKSSYNAAEGTGELSSRFGSFIKSLGSSALTIIKSVGVALVNMVASAALMAGITWLIGKVINLADSLIITKNEAKELASSFNDSFSSMRNSQAETRKTLDGLDEEFLKLSEGVDTLGRNVSLTEEEFDRYHEITNIIAENIPNLIDGYDAQGDAIIRLKGDVESLSEAYREANQQEAYELYHKTDDKGTSIVKGAYKDVDNFFGKRGNWEDFSGRDLTFDEVRDTYERLASMSYAEAHELALDFNNYLEQDLFNMAGMDASTTYDEFISTIHTKFRQQYQEFESEFSAHQKTMANLASEYAQTLPDYWKKYMDNVREYLDFGLNNLDYDSLRILGYTDENGGISQENVERFVVDFMDQLQHIPQKDLDNIEARINVVTLFNNNEVTYGEYQKQLSETSEWLNSLPPVVQTMLKLMFEVDSDDSEIQRAKDYLKLLLGDNYTEDFANSLTKDQLSRVYDIDVKYKPQVEKKYDDKGFEIKPEIDPYSTDYIKKQLEDEVNPIEVEAKVTAVDTVDAMAELKSAVSSLGDLYSQTVQDQLKLGKDKKYVDANGNVTKAINDQGYTIGYADPELINKVETAFSKFTTTAEQNGKDVTVLNNALKTFEETLIKYPNDAERAQQAYDALITAYIDSTDILDGLTEETQEWCIAMLDAMDIENADMVVKSRLNKTTKNLISGYEKLRNAVIDYNKAVADNNTEGMSDGINNITNQLNDMYGFTNQKGEQVNPFDTQFVSQNLDMINAALDDATGKFNELDRMAAKAYILDLIVNTHDTEISMMYNELYNLIAAFDGESIDIGTSMDGTPVMNTLESIRKSTAAAVSDWANMVSQMTGGTLSAEIGWETKHVQLNMPEFSYANYLSDENRGSITSKNVTKYQKTAVDYHLPKFTYTYTGKGTKANYRPSAPAPSGGGGGGNGGGSSSEPNKPKEESEETFDWIEVAIQRIEEEIARLDKVVGNSYDFWTNRNKALLKEINKTKEEIKAQQIAYSEYLRNANNIEVNNGKGLNPDDYGENDADVKKHDQELLDEAIAAWKTGEYQKKVREGLLTGDDIENIANHFLSDTIKSYQELYNKAVAAKDATQDLQIKLGDLARTDFDHIKTEYDEILQYFEAYADLIDKRISRTEEKGYFVSRDYYDKLTDYENKSIAALREETDKLIKKRDEAVNAGYIALNSEEYHEMTQEILDNLQSIEERTNNIYENANKIRQIGWDVFDYAQERISKVTDEFEFLIDLLDNQKMYDDYGIFNERGWANTALHAGKYNAYMQQALDYAKERKEIETELSKDNADKNLIERREELIQLQQESIQNAYAEKDAVKSLVEEGINIHLQALQKLIDDYKKAQQESKSLYDYQKNIAKQTENIGNLRKQLNAYAGDTSEETRATIQKLNQQLKDAEQSLQETQWDKYISETQTFLDDMYKDYEETLNARLDDIDLLMHDMINEVNARGTEISGIIKEVSGEVAYGLTDYTKTFISNGTLVSDFKNKFDTEITNVESILGNIQKYIADIANRQVTPAVNENSIKRGTKLNNHAKYKGVDYSAIFDLEYYMNKYPNLVSVFGTDYDKYIEHFVNYGMKEGRQASETFNLEYYKKKYPDLVKAFGNNNQAYYEHFIEYGIKEGRQASETFSVQMYKNLYEDLAKSFKNDLKKYYEHYNNLGRFEGRRAYATGSKHISSDQLAWTQEQGGELIYRSTDGAILTPLNVGDKVFTAEMSENLWNLAQLKQRPVVSTGASRTVNNTNAISINLPNVQNYEQFKNALQNDPNMTKFIQQVTFGEATNGIKLNRKKY